MGVSVPAYKWAKEIKRLDGNKCVFCGSVIKLEAHHITPRAVSPDRATDLENGITLCHECRYTAHAANYTTNGSRNYSCKGFVVSPELMKSFIHDYESSKIVLSLPDEQMDKIKAHAESTGESVNGFINRAIDETMKKDKGQE